MSFFKPTNGNIVTIPEKYNKQPVQLNPASRGIVPVKYGHRYGTFDQMRKFREELDFTPESTGETIVSEADDFMNVIMASDSDNFDSAEYEQDYTFEDPEKIEMTKTRQTASDVKTMTAQAPATETKSKLPLIAGLGILAYLGLKD